MLLSAYFALIGALALGATIDPMVEKLLGIKVRQIVLNVAIFFVLVYS